MRSHPVMGRHRRTRSIASLTGAFKSLHVHKLKHRLKHRQNQGAWQTRRPPHEYTHTSKFPQKQYAPITY